MRETEVEVKRIVRESIRVSPSPPSFPHNCRNIIIIIIDIPITKITKHRYPELTYREWIRDQRLMRCEINFINEVSISKNKKIVLND